MPCRWMHIQRMVRRGPSGLVASTRSLTAGDGASPARTRLRQGRAGDRTRAAKRMDLPSGDDGVNQSTGLTLLNRRRRRSASGTDTLPGTSTHIGTVSG